MSRKQYWRRSYCSSALQWVENFSLHFTVLHCTALNSAGIYRTTQDCTMLHCTILHCAAMHSCELQYLLPVLYHQLWLQKGGGWKFSYHNAERHSGTTWLHWWEWVGFDQWWEESGRASWPLLEVWSLDRGATNVLINSVKISDFQITEEFENL